MPAVTFFTLLAEGGKAEVAETRRLILAASYPHMEKTDQEQVQGNLQLPDDILSDILEDESGYDDASKLKEVLGE